MRIALYLPACVILAACSSTTQGSGTGDAGSQGGAVPASPDAAWVVNMTGNGTSCPLASSSISLGDVNATMIVQRVSNQEVVQGQTASVICDVAPLSGGGFQVQASASAGADALQVAINTIDAQASKSSPATGTVTYLSSATVTPFSGSCSFYFADTTEGIGAGKLWAAFTCPMLTSGGMQASCPLSESYIAVENCATTAGP